MNVRKLYLRSFRMMSLTFWIFSDDIAPFLYFQTLFFKYFFLQIHQENKYVSLETSHRFYIINTILQRQTISDRVT